MEVQEEKQQKAEPFQVDPMGSMIQNEISAIKDASIAAAKEKMDEWTPWAWAVEIYIQINWEKIGWEMENNDISDFL